MVGVTTIANLNAPAGKQISLYYNLKNQNLGLQQRNESTSQDPPTDVYVSSITAQVGWIENPSQVASANLTGLPLVFGFTEKKADPAVPKQLNHDVSILSPVYNPVGQTLKDNKTIAAVSDGVSASVFFLTYVPHLTFLHLFLIPSSLRLFSQPGLLTFYPAGEVETPTKSRRQSSAKSNQTIGPEPQSSSRTHPSLRTIPSPVFVGSFTRLPTTPRSTIIAPNEDVSKT